MVRIYKLRPKGVGDELVSEYEICLYSNTGVSVSGQVFLKIHVFDTLNSEDNGHGQILEAVLRPVRDHLGVVYSFLTSALSLLRRRIACLRYRRRLLRRIPRIGDKAGLPWLGPCLRRAA